MEWYEIMTLVIGAVGGVGGLISIYKARPERDGIVIKNMKEMLDEAHKLYDEIKRERDSISTEFNEYKDESEGRFEKLEKRVDVAEEETFQLKSTILRGYSCKYPDNPDMCPVLQDYEKRHSCDVCKEKEV